MSSTALSLAQWALQLTPTEDDLRLAQRSLIDTAAVTLAARSDPIVDIARALPEAARWATIGHVLDFDDLHIESTTHISVVIVPAVLASGGDARAYLAGAGVMARLGTALGWPHYTAGWHATCTAGAPAAAVAAGVAMGLSPHQLENAIALALPAAGGVQEAFGSHSKSLQVGFAAHAGVRAAELARTGATARPSALDAWMRLQGGDPDKIDFDGPAVPGGLAIKAFPCCYAMQRPIAAVRTLRERIRTSIERVAIRLPESSVHPLIHNRPCSGLEGKFSLPYAVATAILDSYPDFESFTDSAVNRTEAKKLVEKVHVEYESGGVGLLMGTVAVDIHTSDGERMGAEIDLPPGAPTRPPSPAEMEAKLTACGSDVPALLTDATWQSTRSLFRKEFPTLDR